MGPAKGSIHPGLLGPLSHVAQMAETFRGSLGRLQSLLLFWVAQLRGWSSAPNEVKSSPK